MESAARSGTNDVQETMWKAVEWLVSVKGNLQPVGAAGKEQENNQPLEGDCVAWGLVGLRSARPVSALNPQHQDTRPPDHHSGHDLGHHQRFP